jgi:hypothetical protein
MAFGSNHPPVTNVAALMPSGVAPAATFQALIPNADGPAFINNTATFQALVPGGPFVNET